MPDCKKAAASPDATIVVKMYGKVDRGDVSDYLVVKTRSVEYQTCVVRVPRCAACKSRSERESLVSFVKLLASLGTAYAIIAYGFGLEGWIALGFGAVVGIVLFAASMLNSVIIFPPPDVPSRSNFYHFYPPIHELMKQGWNVGDRRPSGL